MKKTKSLLLTFDYELFLGLDSGSVKKCLLDPTIELFEIAKKHQLSYVFFVDTIYLYRLQQEASKNKNAENDLNLIFSQLRDAIKNGHYVFHHIHPHWLDAVYQNESNSWNLENKNRFALIQCEPNERSRLIKISDEIITSIYKDLPKPTNFAFRAGGLYSQPFNVITQDFINFGISIDSSVLRGAASQMENFSFDYSNFPKKIIYKFSQDNLVEDNLGYFTEISIAQFPLKGIQKIINGIVYRINKNKKSSQRFGDGKSSGNVIGSKNKINSKWMVEETYSVELLNSYKSKLYIKQFNHSDLIHFISHPKLISLDNLASFEKFIVNSKNKYQLQTDFFNVINESFKQKI